MAEEAQLLNEVKHPNVVQLLGFTYKGTSCRMTMELCAGTLGTLLDWDGERLDFRLRCSLALNICDGMAAVHELGVVHYDLKTNNILVVFQGGVPVAKISDFGFARRVNPATGFALARDNDRMHEYPELANVGRLGRSLECVTPALDVYAFGDRVVSRLFHDWLAPGTKLPTDEVRFALAVSSKCLLQRPSERPPFRELAAMFASHVFAE